MANPNLQKIIKLTQTQYNILYNGGTVGDYTGLNDNYLYLIQEDYEFPVTTTARKILMSTSTAGLVQWQSLTANDIPSLNASKINAGIFDTARIPSLAASKITSGIFDTARIPSLAASKITSGMFDTARIPSLDASKITSGTFADARIASASTWNAKYTKPSGGIPASDLAESYALSTHTHTAANIISWLGLGTTRSASSMTWGTLTTANGYTILLATDQPNGGGWVIAEKGGKTYMQIDGDFYVNEGGTRLARVGEAQPASDVYAWAKAATKPSYTASEVGAAAAHHLYHTWDNNTDYYDSFSGDNMFRIITENMYADIFRFQASTVANLEYHNGSDWVAWTFDLSNLFDGNARTGISIPYANRKFRFTMRTNGGWPTTGMFMLQGTWFSDGGWPSGQKSDIIIETRANESASWTQRASFTLSGVEGMAGHTLSSLHTGETYYRITITIYPWTNTSNSCPLQRLCLFSNYNGGALEKITHDGYGNVTIPTLKSTTIYENGTTLANKYLGKTAKAADSDLLDGQDSTYYLNYNNLTNKPSAVLYTSQTLTDAQKTQARTNIGAGTSSFTGYTSSNKLHTDYINNAAGWTSVTETTVTNWGFTKNAGTVTKVDNVSPSSGNVSLSAVRYVAQTLTDAQKTQARTNIGAGTSSFSGSYNDLTNKPTIPTVSNATITIKQTGISDQTFTLNGSAVTITLADTNTTYSAEKGISLSGTKFGHSNAAITAQTTQALYPIKIDAYGHITGYGTAVTSLPASDVYAWAKAATKPSYTLDEVSDGTTRKLANYLPLAGTTALSGNIIPSVNSTSTTTGVSLGSNTNKFNMVNARALRAIGIPASDLSMVEITSDDDDGAVIRVYDGDETNVYYYLPLSGNGGTIATQSWVTDKGYTSNVGTVTSVRVQAGTGLSSSTSTAQTTSLNTTISIASGYKLPTTTEWNGKQNALSTQTAYSAKGSATKVPQITTNTLGQVTGITEVTITNTKTYKHDIILTNSASASSNPSYKICFTLYSNQSTALTITGAIQLLFNKPPAAASANKLAAWARTTTPVYVVVTEWSRAYFYPRTILTDSLTYSGNNLTKFTLRPMEGAMDFDGYNMRISLFTSDLEFTVSNLTISDTVVEC